MMIIGQSAGVAAALAATSDVAVQELPYLQLSQHLLAQRQVLVLPDALKSRSAADSMPR